MRLRGNRSHRCLTHSEHSGAVFLLGFKFVFRIHGSRRGFFYPVAICFCLLRTGSWVTSRPPGSSTHRPLGRCRPPCAAGPQEQWASPAPGSHLTPCGLQQTTPSPRPRFLPWVTRELNHWVAHPVFHFPLKMFLSTDSSFGGRNARLCYPCAFLLPNLRSSASDLL